MDKKPFSFEKCEDIFNRIVNMHLDAQRLKYLWKKKPAAEIFVDMEFFKNEMRELADKIEEMGI